MDRIRFLGQLTSWPGISRPQIGGKSADSRETGHFGLDIGPIFSF